MLLLSQDRVVLPPAGTASSGRPFGPTRRRRSQRRWGKALAITLLATVAVSAPVTSVSYGCAPGEPAAKIFEGQLADDGEVDEIILRTVGEDGAHCEDPQDIDDLDVAVSILHRDDAGETVPPQRLTAGRSIISQVRVTDLSLEDVELEVVGPDGPVRETHAVGVPQLVQITLRYPAGWDVIAPAGDGVRTRASSHSIEVIRTGVLFAPVTAQDITLDVTASSGRGTPSVMVEATPLTELHADVVPAQLLDRDGTAVVGALLELLQDGSEELTEGAGALVDGTEDLATGTEELADGSGELAAGAAALGNGLGAISGGADELVGGLKDVGDGVQELAGGSSQLADGLGLVVDNIVPLAEGADELAAGARHLADELRGRGGEAEPPIDPHALGSAVDNAAAGVRQVRDHLQQVGGQLDGEVAGQLTIAIGVLTDLASGLDEVAVGVGEAIAAMLEATDGIDALAGGVDELAGGAAGVSAGVGELRMALAGLSEGATALAEGTAELATGLQQLAQGGEGLSGGLEELAGGADQLATGAAELAGGTRRLAEGNRELADGVATFAEGAEELPATLGQARGAADRTGERAAMTEAVLEAGAARAKARQGDASSVTTELTYLGDQPLRLGWIITPIALGVVVGGGTVWALRRRRRSS